MEPRTVQTEVMGHTYDIMLHPTDEGVPLAAEVASYLAEPFSRLLEAWAKDMQNEDLENVLRSADWSGIGGDLSKVLMKLAGKPQFVKQLLKHSRRDGKGLEMPQVFNEAYQGNYVELGAAIVAVIRANGFVPFSF